jgi:hypothetical protein
MKRFLSFTLGCSVLCALFLSSLGEQNIGQPKVKQNCMLALISYILSQFKGILRALTIYVNIV